jgi:hypothetical protein
LMQPAPPKAKPSYMRRLIRNGVIQRAYTAVRERMAAYSQAAHHIPQREGLSLEH